MTQTQQPRLSIGRILGNLFAALVGAYGLSVSGFLFLRFLLGESWWVIGVFNSFIHILLLMSPPLLVLCLLFRRFRVLLLLLLPLFVFITSYGVLFLPRTIEPAGDAPRFSLMTYNLRAQSANLDGLLGVIRNSGADIVALQEVSFPTAERLESELSDLYPYQALHPQSDPAYSGQGLLSRFPIESDDYWIVYFGHQRAEVEISGRRVVIYNVHPVPPFTPRNPLMVGYLRRSEEVTDILNRVRPDLLTRDLPLVVAGDFNFTDQSTDYARVSAMLNDTHHEIGQGMGFTYPNFSVFWPRFGFLPPLARIDYVFYNDELRPLDIRVMPETGGSDHHPVFVTLALE